MTDALPPNLVSDDESDPASAEDLAAAISRLGAESDTERAVRRIVPWLLSLLVHAGLIGLGFLVTFTVFMLQDDQENVPIVADFHDLSYEPVTRINQPKAEKTEEAVQDRVPVEVPNDRPDDPSEIDVEALTLISNAASEASLARFAPEPTRATATFVGLSSTNARKIIYVIDASGSMIRALSIVVDELARSLQGLSSRQSFGVIFFQGNEALVVPPKGRLTPGSSSEVTRVLQWIDDNVIPSGRSNPLAALRTALAQKPDVIFLLSEDITGSGEYEIDQRDLLKLLDELNPADASGHRPTRINCVQFLDPDPLDTLRHIAEQHGGRDGYKFLDRAELGL